MKKINVSSLQTYKLDIGYDKELYANRYIKNPDKPGYLIPNPDYDGIAWFVKFDGIRVSDFITQEDAIKLKDKYFFKATFGTLEITPCEEGYVDKSSVIVSCEIVRGNYQNDVIAVNEDGDKYTVFSYYPDELRFSSNEFIGRTGEQACELFHKKDVAYLRS